MWLCICFVALCGARFIKVVNKANCILLNGDSQKIYKYNHMERLITIEKNIE